MRAFAILLVCSLHKLCYGRGHLSNILRVAAKKRKYACLEKSKSLMFPKKTDISRGNEAKSSLSVVTQLLLAINTCSRVTNFARGGLPPSRFALSAPVSSRLQRSPQPRADLKEAEGYTDTSWSTRIRRSIYEKLVPLDKGEFGWSFLVPWTNKTLTSVDKAIICSSFIGSVFTVQSLVNPTASVGIHLAYIAQFFSYTMADPIGFRTLAVLTSVLEIVGNVFEDYDNGLLVNGFQKIGSLSDLSSQMNGEDVFPVFYDELFIIINMYYIMRWILARDNTVRGVEWSRNEESLYTKCFALLGYRRRQFSRLLRSVSFKVASETGDTLTRQGEPITELFVPINGTVEVLVEGKLAATLPPYQLVGEASLLENLQSRDGNLHPESRGTVIAAPGSMYARWPQSAFYELQKDEDSDFAYVIQLMIARQLSKKLKSARISQSNKDMVFESGISAQRSPEIKRFRERGESYEKRIASLEREVLQADQDLSDFKNIITVSVALLAFGFGSMFASTPLNDIF